MIVYAVLAAVGVIGLIVSLVLDDVIAGVFEGPDWLTGITVSSFLAVVGLCGLLVGNATAEPVTGIIALVGGVLAAGIVHIATRRLFAASDVPAMTTADLVGKQGTSILGSAAEASGEVMLSVHGQRLKVNGRCATALRPGQLVTVTAASSIASVTVVPA